MQIGGLLKLCRERAGLSQEELAYKLHRSQSCISKLEQDKKTLDVATFVQWLNITQSHELGVAFLFGMDIFQIVQQIMPFLGG